MDYVSPVNELALRLTEAAKQLAFPPSSTKDLLELLDKTEHLLTFVGQAPTISMQGALVPAMGALIADGLLKHSEVDVRVSVASCLCEVARITAPNPPYKDAIVKDIFRLFVLAFGQLSNVTGQSYHKAIHILESVAKVKSYLLLLDLECDALVLEIFEKFISEIRVDHPHTVYSDMEAIMTIIIQESDEIATELLSLLISHVKKENQIVTPASCKLTEKVLRNSKDTLKPYSETIMKLVNSNPDEYTDVVNVVCQNGQENGHMVTRSTRTNNYHKRDFNTLENGGSMKKRKYIDKDHLNGKELETSRRGQPKKNKITLNQDNCTTSVRNSKEDTRRTRFQDKKQSSKAKGNIGNSGSLYNVVIKKEDEFISDHDREEPLMQQNSNNKTKSRRKPSSNKRLANGSRSKEIPKKWGQDLVGHRVKVWWPLDKMYYEGAVSSYDPVDGKHKVLYADGDEEVLDLHTERWQMLDDILPDLQQEQVADLPSSITTSAKRPKQKRKQKSEASQKQEENSKSPKSSPPADSSNTADVTCNDDNQKNDPVSTPAESSKTENVICNADNQKNTSVSTPDISCGPKPTEKETDDMEKIGDSKAERSKSSEITQRLENTDEIVCET